VRLSTAPCAKPEAGELLERCGRECGSHAARTHRRRAIDRGGTSSSRAERRPGIPFHPGRETAYRSHVRRRPRASVDPHRGLPANLKTARLLRAFEVTHCSRQLYCRHALQRSGNTSLKGLRYFRHDVRGHLHSHSGTVPRMRLLTTLSEGITQGRSVLYSGTAVRQVPLWYAPLHSLGASLRRFT
jgi:hypothetical protein